ncbi:hypothetical protein BJI69_16110 [Luteibacter rhizovicinus DSM 16549]|uniref:Uncharacterized protein n=1 Tax=Luteibacter rhizovicinus DSM 16549 TaxID=1440763 RepID=A0A0G9HEE0_9GAMM|nr:DUF2058 family protein [Luteibacter rhizovicinus]APG05272.1 hypothetical protein BJI69_16110 [Luteibacter rhizovicinus DSM 16549]KLD67891.1 hypothetical protein Y883_05785 [Luteibacter rhizovicinus DSM 16549]KLD74827.1 hypothetical protein Y886_30495 [Xanthomonas hyacinthi DSM 19077]
MAESLRDQLLKSGLVKEVREEKRTSAPPRQASSDAAKGGRTSAGSGQPYAGNNPRQGAKPAQGGRPQQGGKPQQGGRPPQGNRPQGGGRPQQGGKPGAGGQPRPPRTDGEIDLAKAYAIRAQTDATERRRLEAEAAEQARLRKERKRKVEELLKGKALNLADADQVRHFPYGEKIRRVHVDAAQLVAINAGELGVVQQGGRYLVVDKGVISELQELAPEFIALLVDPNAVSESDDGVPDDLMW